MKVRKTQKGHSQCGSCGHERCKGSLVVLPARDNDQY